MLGNQILDGLHLYDYFTRDKKICLILAYNKTVGIVHFYRNLLFCFDAKLFKPMLQRILIYFFEKPGTEIGVYLISRLTNMVCYL